MAYFFILAFVASPNRLSNITYSSKTDIFLKQSKNRGGISYTKRIRTSCKCHIISLSLKHSKYPNFIFNINRHPNLGKINPFYIANYPKLQEFKLNKFSIGIIIALIAPAGFRFAAVLDRKKYGKTFNFSRRLAGERT